MLKWQVRAAYVHLGRLKAARPLPLRTRPPGPMVLLQGPGLGSLDQGPQATEAAGPVPELPLSWYRLCDLLIAGEGGGDGVSEGEVRVGSGWRSYRGGGPAVSFIHPANERKRDAATFMLLADAAVRGHVPPAQAGKVDAVGDALLDWLGPPREEDFVFVVVGRCVPGTILNIKDTRPAHMLL